MTLSRSLPRQSHQALRAAALGSASLAALAFGTAPAFSQDADAVAERFVMLLESQPDATTDIAYESAMREGDAVVLTNVTADVEGEAMDWALETVTIVNPDIARDNALEADAIDIANATLTAPYGTTTIASITSSDVLIGNPSGEIVMSYARESVATDLATNYVQGGGFTIEALSATTEYDAETFGFMSQNAQVTGVLVSRDDFADDRQTHFDLFGVDEFQADASYAVSWQDDTFAVDELVIDSPSMGRLSLSLGVGNITPQLIDAVMSQNAEAMQSLAMALTFTGLSLTMENGDKFDTAVRRQADNVGMTEREYREEGIARVRQAFAVFAGTPFAREALPEIEDYLDGRADRIEIVAAPPAAVPFVAIGMTAFTSPGSAVGLLNLSVTSD